VRLIREKGTGAQLAKLDLENAYRMIPVHPDDHLLIRYGMEGATIYRYCIAIWAMFSTKCVHSSGGCTDVDISQIWGVCRAPLFRCLFVGAPDSNECQQAIALALKICEWLGAQVSIHKLEGPSNTHSIFGNPIGHRQRRVKATSRKAGTAEGVNRPVAGEKILNKARNLIIDRPPAACL